MNECDERWRVRFDADVTFWGGGRPRTQGFPLDHLDSPHGFRRGQGR